MGIRNKKFTAGQHSSRFFRKYAEITGLKLNQVKPGMLVWDPATNSWWYLDNDGVPTEVSTGGLDPIIDGGTY